MKKRDLHNFAIIGTGMVGTAIGFLLKKAGYRVAAVCDKSSPALKRAISYTGGHPFKKAAEAVLEADFVLITTPDDEILNVCKEISLSASMRGKFFLHMSGAGGLDLLEPARRKGALIASIHPLQSFSSIDQAIQNIPGSYFGVTADKSSRTKAKNIVRKIGGIPVPISKDQKPLYHAAACFASNYLVSLIHVVESIYQCIGIKGKDAKKAYLPLIYGSLKNIEKSGPILSLTGPIARGDLGTVKKHLRAIKKQMPEYFPLYSTMGAIAVDIARKKGTLNHGKSKKMTAILKGKKHEHSK